MPVVFVRYNPDNFTIGSGERIYCELSADFKRVQLVRTVKHYLKTVLSETMETVFKRSTILVHYLFYDNTDQSYERKVGIVENNGILEDIVV